MDRRPVAKALDQLMPCHENVRKFSKGTGFSHDFAECAAWLMTRGKLRRLIGRQGGHMIGNEPSANGAHFSGDLGVPLYDFVLIFYND